MVDSGLLAAGYDTLMIADCWAEHKRSEVAGPNGEPVHYLPANLTTFPNGMKTVVV